MFLNSLKQNRKKGFTIIELLVVISIIGLLSTISVVSLNGARIKSRDAKRVSDISQLKTAIELYFNDQGYYPAEGVPVSLGTGTKLVLCDVGFVASASSCNSNKIYMGKVPRNPGPNGMEYTYTSITSSENYNLAYSLEQGTASLPSGYNMVDGGNGETTSDPLEQGLVAYYPLNSANEILGNEIVGSLNFVTGWTISGPATVISANSYSTTAIGGLYKNLFTAGKRYRISISGTTNATKVMLANANVNQIYLDNLTGNFVVENFDFVPNYADLYIRNAGAGTSTIITKLEIREVFARDQTSYANNGTNYGTTLTTGVRGEVNGAYYFNSTNSYIDFGNKSQFNFGTGSFSISAWVNTSAMGTTKAILGKTNGLTAASSIGYTLYLGNAGTVWSFGTWDGTNNIISTASATVNTWTHLVGVFDSTTKNVKIYANKMQGSSVSNLSLGNIDVANGLFIGKTTNSGIWYGNIANVRLYNRALSTTEIDLLYDQGR